jgi:hypothetical protein
MSFDAKTIGGRLPFQILSENRRENSENTIIKC